MDIPSTTTEEQIDRYARGLKPFIWRELGTRVYDSATDLIRDAERIDSAFRRSDKYRPEAQMAISQGLLNRVVLRQWT